MGQTSRSVNPPQMEQTHTVTSGAGGSGMSAAGFGGLIGLGITTGLQRGWVAFLSAQTGV